MTATSPDARRAAVEEDRGQERGVVKFKCSQFFLAEKTSGAVVFFENIYSEND